jgi:hypothetical protein
MLNKRFSKLTEATINILPAKLLNRMSFQQKTLGYTRSFLNLIGNIYKKVDAKKNVAVNVPKSVDIKILSETIDFHYNHTKKTVVVKVIERKLYVTRIESKIIASSTYVESVPVEAYIQEYEIFEEFGLESKNEYKNEYLNVNLGVEFSLERFNSILKK